MKRLQTILFLLLFSLGLSGQDIIRANPFHGVVSHDTLGPEMIQNGDFDSATGWATDANWSIAGGVATYDDIANSNFGQIDDNMLSSLEINTTYRIEFDVAIASGNANFRFASTSNEVVYIAYADYANGFYSFEFTTPADIAQGGIVIRAQTSSTTTFTLDNISIKKVL